MHRFYLKTSIALIYLVLFAVQLILASSVSAFEISPDHNGLQAFRLSNHILAIQDPDFELSPDTAIAKFNSPNFITDQWNTNAKHYWFYIPLINRSDEQNWAIHSNNILFNSSQFYLYCADTELQHIPRPELGISSPSLATSFYLPITLPTNTACGFLHEASTVAFYPTQTYLLNQSGATVESNLQTTFSLIGLGTIIGLIIYNLLLGISIPSSSYFVYVLYAGVHFSFLLFISYLPRSLIPLGLEPMHIFRLFSALLIITFILFSRNFMRPGVDQLQTKPGLCSRLANAMYKYSTWLLLLMLMFIAEIFVWPDLLAYTVRFFPQLYILCSLYILVFSFLMAVSGYRPAWAFFPAWSILILSHIIGALDIMGSIELNGWSRIQAILGGAMEMMLLSIALGIRFKESQAEKERTQLARKHAEQLAEKQEKFISTLSHEIRTPLHAMLGATGLLGKTSLSDQQQRYWSTTHYAAESMHALVDNLLDRTLLKKHDQPQVFAPLKLLTAMVQLLSHKAEDKGLRVILSADNLPEKLHGNPVVTRRVLINLISNSIKYTDSGTIHIKADWHAELRCLEVCIEDTGQGISQEQLAQIKTPYNTSVESLYNQDPSTGLGLPICYELISHSGGSIDISSELDKGTKACFSLPMSLSTIETATHSSTSDHQSSDIEKTLNILIVDDIASNRMIACELLTIAGHHVKQANDGKQALECLQQQAFDIIVSDLRMPHINGEELLQTLRQQYSNDELTIIITSAHIDTDKQTQLLSMGANACLIKPYSPEELIALINSNHPQTTRPNPQKHYDVISELEQSLGTGKSAQIINLYNEQLAKDRQRIFHGINARDAHDIHIAAHRIVSASCALGLHKNASAALVIEQQSEKMISNTGSWHDFSQKVSELIEQIEEITNQRVLH